MAVNKVLNTPGASFEDTRKGQSIPSTTVSGTSTGHGQVVSGTFSNCTINFTM